MSYRRIDQPPSGGKLINNVHLVKHRRIDNGNNIKRHFDIMSEDKASRYKMEETLCSLPATVKSTFLMIFSPDGQRVASTHGDDRIYICDLTTGKLIETLQGHPKTPWCLAWHPINKEILASGCLGGEVRVWYLRSKACDVWSNEQSCDIASLAFHPNDRILVIATSNEIHFWDWSQSKPYAVKTTTFEKEKVRFVRFDSSGTKLITGITNLPKVVNYNSEALQSGVYQDRFDPIYHGVPSNRPRATSGSNPSLPESIQISSNRPSLAPSDELNAALRRRQTVFLRLRLLYQQLERLEESPGHNNPALQRIDVLDSISLSRRGGPSTSSQQQSQNQAITSSSRGTNTESVLFDLANHNNDRWTFTRVTPQDINPERRENLVGLIRQPHSVHVLARLLERSLQQTSSDLLRNNNASNGGENSASSSRQQTDRDGPPSSSASLDSQHPLYQLDPCRGRLGRIIASLRSYRQTALRIALASMNPLELSHPPTENPSDEAIMTTPFIMLYGGQSGASSIPDRVRQRLPPEVLSNIRDTPNINPILSIQFKGSGITIPLSAECHLDVLCARLKMIMLSQNLLEQMNRLNNHHENIANPPSNSTGRPDMEDNLAHPRDPVFSLFMLLNQLYRALHDLNHSDLTLSNVKEFIQKARRRVERIIERLTRIGSHCRDIVNIRLQIYTIARLLTSRDCDQPVSDSMEDLSLDLIHCLCIVDLALHFTRQVQFMQACDPILLNENLALARSNGNAREEGGSRETSPMVDQLQRLASLLSRPNTRSQATPPQARGQSDGIKNEQQLANAGSSNISKRRLEKRLEYELSCSTIVKRKRTSNPETGSNTASEPGKATQAVKKAPSRHVSDHETERRAPKSSVSTRSMTRMAKQNNDTKNSDCDHHDESVLKSQGTKRASQPISSEPTTNSSSQARSSSSASSGQPRLGQQMPAHVRVNHHFTPEELTRPPYISRTIRPVSTETGGSLATRASTSQNGTVRFVVSVFSPSHPSSAPVLLQSPQLSSNQDQSETSVARPNGDSNSDRTITSSRQQIQPNNHEMSIESNLTDFIRLPNNVDVVNIPNYHHTMSLQIMQARQRRLRGEQSADVENLIQGPHPYSPQEIIDHLRGPPPGPRLVIPRNHAPSGNIVGPIVRDVRVFARSNLFSSIGGHPINPNINHWWWNSWGIAFSNQTQYRIQCWDFSQNKLPEIKDSHANVVASKSRIHNDASIDVSSDGRLLACLVPQTDGVCTPPIDFKIYSIMSKDFGTCYYRWSCGPTTRSVSISPLGGYVVVGLTCQKSSLVTDQHLPNETMVIARIFKLNGPHSLEHVRDVSIDRNDYLMSLNLIKWLPRSGQGLIYGTNRGQLIIARPLRSDQQYSSEM